MKQIVIIFLSTIIALVSYASAEQYSINFTPFVETVTDNINPPYAGNWAWHNVHKKTAKEFIKRDPPKKTDACLHCHAKDKYKIFDPHIQLNEEGDILREKCLYCHKEKPDEEHAAYEIDNPAIKFVSNLDELCLGCHRRQLYFTHPVNARHIVRPSYKMQAMMEASEKEFGIILPLDFEGKIMCATCHNPHEKGVIPKEKFTAKGAGDKDRIRLTNQAVRAALKMPEDKYLVLPAGKFETGTVQHVGNKLMIRMKGTMAKICTTCHKDIIGN